VGALQTRQSFLEALFTVELFGKNWHRNGFNGNANIEFLKLYVPLLFRLFDHHLQFIIPWNNNGGRTQTVGTGHAVSILFVQHRQ
jgi:hypothetical protein